MIYTVGNTSAIGKPARVFVGGNEIANVVYADTKKELVKYRPDPVRVEKNLYGLYERALKGKVEVIFT